MLLVACTGTGLATFVTERSAESATVAFTVALLLPPFGSIVVEETESGWVMVAPALAAVSVQVGVAPRTHVHPAGPVNDTAVVLAGRVSVKTGAFAVAGP